MICWLAFRLQVHNESLIKRLQELSGTRYFWSIGRWFCSVRLGWYSHAWAFAQLFFGLLPQFWKKLSYTCPTFLINVWHFWHLFTTSICSVHHKKRESSGICSTTVPPPLRRLRWCCRPIPSTRQPRSLPANPIAITSPSTRLRPQFMNRFNGPDPIRNAES